jgi:maleate isomerase
VLKIPEIGMTQVEVSPATQASDLSSLQLQVRLGVILPSVNTVIERWYNRALPQNVSLHAARMQLFSPVSRETLERMDHEEGMAAAQRLASCRPHAIAYGCTASSIVQGREYDKRLRDELERATDVPCFTAVGAIVEALNFVNARTICVASPYSDAIDHTERAFFESAGFTVSGTANLGIEDGFALASPGFGQMLALARRAWKPGADALLISCLNMNSQDVAERLEQEIERPVVTSTTATLWKLMRAAGIDVPIKGYGRLLDGR